MTSTLSIKTEKKIYKYLKKKKSCWMYVRRCISRNVQTELLVS